MREHLISMTTIHNSINSCDIVSTPSSELIKKTHRPPVTNSASGSSQPERTYSSKNGTHLLKPPCEEFIEGKRCSSPTAGRVEGRSAPPSTVEESGRERLKRHRVEVAGRVWIPDIWGQEELLKDWTDCSVFDASLGNKSIMSARAALAEERRTANSGILRIENRC